ncbi:pancreatic lipase-related protein 2-like [Bicyclus anynana]|uniref:Pancreatic lipase-related protein 2-like n=1 Tax=Bicyclus anynana TaxID=110368 RepID=A0ABM3LG51_BICAN|nr:pancreatic lipase-related protein 2-like [Bicyclus anynana]
MTKNTTLSEKTRKTLKVIALRPSSGLMGSEEVSCPLSRRGARCVAKHLDFKKRKTLVFVSGYLDASFSPICRAVASPYLERGTNVIIVEIYPILHRTYPVAARLTKPLGHILGEFLVELTRMGLTPHKLELLGGSLGAHIASYAAIRYHELTHLKPARLTGLDPAGPCFRRLPRSERINPEVAHQVDAVHTNIDGFGLPDPVGHVDFYINGGEFQPAMELNYLLPCLQLCSHVRAAIYWIIANYEPDKFLAVHCSSLDNVRRGNCYQEPIYANVLGPKTNFSMAGLYYLPTTESYPFYLGEKGLKQRKFAANNYLLNLTPDEDIVV